MSMDIEDMTTGCSYTSSVTLVITGENISPDEVTSIIGLIPNKVWKKGDERKFKNGRVFVYPWSGWKLLMDDEVADKGFEEQLAYWCAILFPRKEALEQITSKSMSIFLECYLSVEDQITTSVDNHLLTKLASTGASLSFSIFHFKE